MKTLVRPNLTGLFAGIATTPKALAKQEIDDLKQFAGPRAGRALLEMERAAEKTPGAPVFSFRPDIEGGGSLDVSVPGRDAAVRWSTWIRGNTFENPDPGHYIFRSDTRGWKEFVEAKVDPNGKLAYIGIKDTPHLFTNGPDLSWTAE
jgi:hypothetical protein